MMLHQFISFRATEFSGTTVGLAYMSTMCTPYHSVGIVQVCLEINSWFYSTGPSNALFSESIEKMMFFSFSVLTW